MESFRYFPKVSEIAHNGVVCLSETSTVAESVTLMERNNLSNIAFSHGKGFSIFTVDDLLVFKRQYRDMNTRLRELETMQLKCVSEDTNVLDLLPEFDSSKSRYLGVKDVNGLLVGIVSYTDVLDSIDPSVMMERRKLGDILNSNRIETVDADTPAYDVLLLLNHVEDAVLITEMGKLCGIITTKDVIKIFGKNLDTTIPVRKYMSSPVYTISTNETVKGAIAYLKDRRFKRVIVTDDETGHVVGLVSQRDLIQSTYGRWAELVKLHANGLNELIRILEARNQRLEEESLTDQLTEVGNRRYIFRAIETEVGRHYRQNGACFSLLMLDIDFFKRINDTNGHATGDDVLRHLCQTVRGVVRISDCIGRWGGEEFVVLLPDTSLIDAESMAERIRARIENTPFNELAVTVSIGVAEYANGETIDTLLAHADSALYQAKRTGRNRVVSTKKGMVRAQEISTALQ
jgi:diguanylate cyclase (GGDEF)-like protein